MLFLTVFGKIIKFIKLIITIKNLLAIVKLLELDFITIIRNSKNIYLQFIIKSKHLKLGFLDLLFIIFNLFNANEKMFSKAFFRHFLLLLACLKLMKSFTKMKFL